MPDPDALKSEGVSSLADLNRWFISIARSQTLLANVHAGLLPA